VGELGFVGAAYDEFEGCRMAFAFSGALSEEDLEVAKYGIEKMKGYISELQRQSSPIKKEQFIQVTIVVDDIQLAAKTWAKLLGVPEPEIWVNHLEGNREYPYTYRGKNTPCDLQMCVIEMGNWVLELHQVDQAPSTFREFQNKHAFGVHHLGFEVGDARDEVISQLQKMGFDTERTIGIYPGSSWTIVDTENILGVNLNIKPKR
jgi:catechol 2,3-dioxygenase-like lactoylglutathione lyase family enzyme